MQLHLEDIQTIFQYSTNNKQWDHKPNTTSHILAYQLNGEIEHLCNGNSYLAEKDSVIVINSEDYYKAIVHENSSCISINLTFLEPFMLHFSIMDGKLLPHVKSDFMCAYNAWNRRDSYSWCDCASLIYSIIGKILRYTFYNDSYIQHSKYKNIEDAHEYILHNYNIPDLSIEDIANIAKLSRRRFGELFKQFYKISPSRYLTNLRITNAKEMLYTQKYSINEIAELSGYASTAYFCRIFKNETRLSPTHWIKNEMNGTR